MDQGEAIRIASRLAGAAAPDGAAALAHVRPRAVWIVRLHPDADYIWVDGETGQASWVRRTADEWERATDPRRMLLAARHRVDPLAFWRFTVALGRRLWDRLTHDQERFAIETAERWLDGRESEDELTLRWFNATGYGAGLESGWAVADEMLASYSDALSPQQTCDLIRVMLGNLLGIAP